MKRPAANVRPEVQLIFCLARTELSDPARARCCELLQQNLDWPRLLSMASPHGVLPLLHWQISRNFSELVPEEILDQLQGRFLATAAHSHYLAGELCKLQEIFAAENIIAIPYKGPTLAAMAYGNLALREFCDLDIMVHQRDVARVSELLVAHGFHAAMSPQEGGYHHHFAKHDGGVHLEIHWAFSSKQQAFPVALEELQHRLVPVGVGEINVRTFGPEDTLLILCVHSAKHLWRRLEWICDVGELIRSHPQMNWEHIVERAEGLGCRRRLLVGLRLASDLLDVALPSSMQKIMEADRKVQPLAAWLSERLFTDSGVPSGVLNEYLHKSELLEYRPDQIRHWLTLRKRGARKLHRMAKR